MEILLAVFGNHNQTSFILIIALSLIVLYLLGMTMLMAIVFLNRLRVKIREHRKEMLMVRYMDKIFAMLVEEQKTHDPHGYFLSVEKLRKKLSKKSGHILTQVLYHLSRDMTGVAGVMLKNLYIDLKMDLLAIHQLCQGTKYQKFQAVKELGRFEVMHALPFIKELTKDSYEPLRNEAQYTLMRLGGIDQLNFLATFDGTLTQWQQIRILNVFKYIDVNQLPSFHVYLTNPNEYVTCFILKLIRIYKQADAISCVRKSLTDTRPLVQKEAILTISLWMDRPIANLLIHQFTDIPLENQLTVVRVLGQWKNEPFVYQFLHELANTTKNFFLQTESNNALLALTGVLIHPSSQEAENFAITNTYD